MVIFLSDDRFVSFLHSIPSSDPINFQILFISTYCLQWLPLFGSAGSGSGVTGVNHGFDCFGQQKGATRVASRSGDLFV
jgi:hypothetical protein